jgi:transcriptional regulator with XRE-family HTH domain
MTDTTVSIGEQLRILRGQRGLTQEALAERAGVSVDLVKKLEQGQRESARLTTLIALANALDSPLSQMVGRRPRLDGGSDRLVLGLRDAVLSPRLLPVYDGQDIGEAPPPVEQLWATVRRCWRLYWEGHFVELARTLPGLIGEAHAAQREDGTAAAGPLAQAYQLAANLLVHLGREDLAALGAERGIAAAAAGDDELQWATLHGTYAWALLMQARYDEAEQLAIRTAERIEPRFSQATPQHLVVWGGLVLWAMAAAVEGAQADAAKEYISLSRVGAARLEHDRHDYEVNFGPTQVAMQTTYTYATLGEPDRALVAARDVRREDLYTISYGRHLLDVAQAHVDQRHDDAAVEVLQEAKTLAPVWFRHQPPARSLVAQVRERKTRPSAALRDLVASLGPA